MRMEARTFFPFLGHLSIGAFLERRLFFWGLLCWGSQQVSDSCITHVAVIVSQGKIKLRSFKRFPRGINASLGFCQMPWCIYAAGARQFRACVWKEFRILRQSICAWGNVMTPPEFSFQCFHCASRKAQADISSIFKYFSCNTVLIL